jgi:hypothetical protein
VNYTQKQLAKGAWKSAVLAFTGVVIANGVDTPNPVMSLMWFKHVGIQSFFVLVITEARYWNQWAGSGDERSLPAAIGKAADLAQQTEKAIDEVKHVDPEAKQ